jgi:predicted O-methyltransferase YrrM
LSIEDSKRLLQDWTTNPVSSTANKRRIAPNSERGQPIAGVTQPSPLLIAEKTYNTSHPDYDVTVARNFPGKILNAETPCRNPVYADLRKLATTDSVADAAWLPVLQSVLAEAKTVAHANLILHRHDTLEQYLADLERRYGARYIAGWVNLDDALFLYWLVRSLKPKTIVQCGVCNGLSSAFMMLALAKNGPDGQLHAIDIPQVFNSKDPAWTIPGRVYGEVVPEGKLPGWMVPEAYQPRFHVQNGDAKILLPQLVEQLPAVDLFYHDSTHTYDHMMFEFHEAKRKLVPGGLVVADDISWNSSLWDFADEHGVPAYNFKGAVGVAFF